MKLSEKQRKEFEKKTREVIKFLNENCHPHVIVNITTTSAELSEGVTAYTTDDYLKD